MSKLTRYGDAVVEAACIAAVVSAPLFFNRYSFRSFEPDKVAILRTLALLVVGVWVIKLLDHGIAGTRLR